MELFLPKDIFDNYSPPRLFLCTTGGKRMQELQYYEGSLNAKWNSYSDLNFSIDRTYLDVLTGETRVHPAFDKAESLRLTEVENIGLFILQDTDDVYSDKDSKSLSAFSAEYSCGSKYLENFYINTGMEDSKEVIYLSTEYGNGYTLDENNLYKLASGAYDPYISYYIMEYTDTDKYEYKQTDINETDYNNYLDKHTDEYQPHEKLYVKSYPNVQFYNPNKKGLSLLHLVFQQIPDWKIGNVDVNLWRKERKFEVDRNDVYSFLTQDIADTFNCVVSWNTLDKTVDFFEEADDGLTEDNHVATRWDTDVYISKENLANEIQIKVSGDNIKTQLKVSGGEDLSISEVNLGKNYILNLDYYHNEDWMEQDLMEAYDDYLDAVKYYSPIYEDAVQGWLTAQKEYNHLMHNIAVETSVVLVGDVFKKLYCLYEPYDTAYIDDTIDGDYQDGVTMVDNLYSEVIFIDEEATFIDENIINKSELTDGQTFVIQGYRFDYDSASNKFKFKGSMLPYNKIALLDKLWLYHVDDDIDGKTNDNILLTLKDVNSNTATIRIYDPKAKIETYNPDLYYYVKGDDGKFTDVKIADATAFAGYNELYTNDYKIKCVFINASNGVPQEPDIYDLSEWINGTLTDKKLGLEKYTITSIGIMGAYLVLAKDESDKSVLEDYGINQLQEKYDAYVKVFLTQTEAMLNKEGKNCILSDENPGTGYKVGDRWLDTNSRPAALHEYDGTEWKNISAQDDKQIDAENYARYIDNYEKMVATQEMLVQKKQEAEYWRDGYLVPNRSISYKKGDSDVIFYSAADAFFRTEADGNDKVIISNGTLHTDYDIPVFTFTHHSAQQSYIKASGVYNKDEQYYQKVITVYDLDTHQPATETTAEDRRVNIETYKPVAIASKEVYDTYDGASNDKTLYVLAKDNLFAVYLVGTTPYVAYAESMGVYMAKRQAISRKTDFESFFDDDQWMRLSPLIREDVFEDSNFFYTGYESTEEEFKIVSELVEAATKELKTLSQPSFEFSMTMANILALPEFEPLIQQTRAQFALGNFIRIELRPGLVKRSRLLECNINFDDFSDFSCTFGNLITTKSEIDLHADLLKQSITAGKQFAASKGEYQSAVDKSNKLEQALANGLQDVALRVSEASGQAISWDSTGMHFRKYKPGSTTEFEKEEMAIINNALMATNDSWRTSKAAFGKYTINGEDRWGPIAEYITADTIEGKYISGGSIEIGTGNTKFKVDENGNVSIMSGGEEKYASSSAMQVIDDAYRYRVDLVYTDSTIFSNTEATCAITCTIYDNRKKEDVTKYFVENGAKFSWKRVSSDSDGDDEWNNDKTHKDVVYSEKNPEPNKIIITAKKDVVINAQFLCDIAIDETNLPSDETQQS
jgi:hypothetical protein